MDRLTVNPAPRQLVDRLDRERRQRTTLTLKAERRKCERRAAIRNLKINNWMERFDAARNSNFPRPYWSIPS